MKRLIRSKATSKYFASDGTWTANPGCAEEFPDIRSLLRAKRKHELLDVEIVFLMQQTSSRYDVIIPLQPEF
jgi:hypothetical protein